MPSAARRAWLRAALACAVGGSLAGWSDLASANALAVGKPAPPLVLHTLDGNTIANSASVVQKPVVGEIYTGLVVTYGHFRGDFLVLFESDTFESQPQSGQYRGILTIGCQF